MQIYDLKDLVSQVAGIDKKKLERLKSGGIEHIVIYKTDDKIYKVTNSVKEYQACNRLKGNDFKNVVKIHDVHTVKATHPLNIFGFTLYIIEQERLYRFKHSNTFEVLDMDCLETDPVNRVNFFVDIMNGILELASVGIKHTDLHALNTMNDKSGNLKIIDFGCAKTSRKSKKNSYPRILVKN